jgi:hypothetical protein
MDIPPSVAALVESAATPFERAHAMPASAYTCPEFLRRELDAIFARVKALLDKVNAEDKACTERVYRGALAGDARPGPLSHLERPNHDFARYLATRLVGLSREFPVGRGCDDEAAKDHAGRALGSAR